jgi:WhiB family redox-sensing transcriptional regulator
VTIQRLRPDDDWWRRVAACAGIPAEWFFPPEAEGRGGVRTNINRRAKEVCAACSVSCSCLHHALAHAETLGVWGGLDQTERRKLSGRIAVDLMPREVPPGLRRAKRSGDYSEPLIVRARPKKGR